MTTPAVLALEDGTVFRGISIGAEGTSTGEVVFNTAMTGYQEILTDPSYSRQIVTLTYPHIGNTGTNSEDLESNTVHAAGLVIRDLPLLQFELACHRRRVRVPEAAPHRRHRRNRYPQAHAHPARKRRPGRLHRQWRCRDAARARDRSCAPVPGPKRHGSRQGRLHRPLISNGTKARTGRSSRGRDVAPASACTWWPTTSASSATSCDCWPIMAAA